MAWVLVGSLEALRRDLNTTCPNRDKTSDGTIGDAAHKLRPSGHNPDDMVGSKPEYTDTDTKQEVRAYDADEDLNTPGITMMQVVKAILATPADRDRLAYIIYERTIWRKSDGWRASAYSGDNPHDRHAHFSGDPIHDENRSPWTSILNLKKGTDMSDFTDDDPNAWKQARRIESIHKNLPNSVADDGASSEPNGLHVKLEEIKTAVANVGVTLTEEQYSDLQDAITETIDETLTRLFAEKLGELIESTYSSEAFKNGVKAGVRAQLDDNPNT